MKGGLIAAKSKSLSKSHWYENVRDMEHEDNIRYKLMEIITNNRKLHTIGLEMKLLLRLMISNMEIHEIIWPIMNERALEATHLQQENEKCSSICLRLYGFPKKSMQAMKKEFLSMSRSAYKSLFKRPSKLQRRLDRKYHPTPITWDFKDFNDFRTSIS